MSWCFVSPEFVHWVSVAPRIGFHSRESDRNPFCRSFPSYILVKDTAVKPIARFPGFDRAGLVLTGLLASASVLSAPARADHDRKDIRLEIEVQNWGQSDDGSDEVVRLYLQEFDFLSWSLDSKPFEKEIEFWCDECNLEGGLAKGLLRLAYVNDANNDLMLKFTLDLEPAGKAVKYEWSVPPDDFPIITPWSSKRVEEGHVRARVWLKPFDPFDNPPPLPKTNSDPEPLEVFKVTSSSDADNAVCKMENLWAPNRSWQSETFLKLDFDDNMKGFAQLCARSAAAPTYLRRLKVDGKFKCFTVTESSAFTSDPKILKKVSSIICTLLYSGGLS